MSKIIVTPSDAPIDLNAPMRSDNNEYTSLWRAVILRALRDSCDCPDQARINAGYTTSKDFREVCALANLNFKMVKAKLIAVHQSEDVRYQTFQDMVYFKSKTDKSKKLPKYKPGKKNAKKNR